MQTASFFSPGLDLADPRCVSIARSAPRQWSRAGRHYVALAPWAELLTLHLRGLDDETYARLFNQYLAGLDARRVVADLGADAILLCWERAGRFCHRRLVARWLEDSLGIAVPEWPEVVDADAIR